MKTNIPSIEHLLSTRDYPGDSLLEAMNIKTNILVMNQTQDKVESPIVSTTSPSGYQIKVINLNEQGLGISRETALLRATSDILLFTDDDLCYYDNYTETISKAFLNNPKADLIFFKVDRLNCHNRPVPKQKPGIQRVPFYRTLRFGAVNIAVKKNCVKRYNLHFDNVFASKDYPGGEDTLFIWSAARSGLTMYSCDTPIAVTDLKDSSWFTEYNSGYLENRGALWYRISPKLYPIFALRFALKKRNLFKGKFSLIQMLKIMNQGKRKYIKEFGR